MRVMLFLCAADSYKCAIKHTDTMIWGEEKPMFCSGLAELAQCPNAVSLCQSGQPAQEMGEGDRRAKWVDRDNFWVGGDWFRKQIGVGGAIAA